MTQPTRGPSCAAAMVHWPPGTRYDRQLARIWWSLEHDLISRLAVIKLFPTNIWYRKT